MTDTPESRQLRLVDARPQSFGSSGEAGKPNTYGLTYPRMSTLFEGNENFGMKTDPVDKTWQGWWPEDFHTQSEFASARSSIKRVSNTSKSIPETDLFNEVDLSGARHFFSSTSTTAENLAGKDGHPFHRGNSACLQIGSSSTSSKSFYMGLLPATRSKLTTYKCTWDCAIGFQMQIDTANTNVNSNSQFKLLALHLLYKKESSDSIYYAPIVEGANWKNKDALELGNSFDPNMPGGKDPTTGWGKGQIPDGWIKRPSVGGNFSAYISESDIDIVTNSDRWTTVGMVMSVKFEGGDSKLNIYDCKPLFKLQDAPKRNFSYRMVPPPMLYSETFNDKSFRFS